MKKIHLKEFFNSIYPISSETWNKIEHLFVEKELKKGEYFVKEGENLNEIAFLEEGIVRAFYRNSEGQEYNKHFFINPCFIGPYSSLVTNKKNQINQQALIDTKILVVNYSEFSAFYETCFDLHTIARKLAELFFVQKEQREIDIVLLDAEKRYLLFQKYYSFIEQQIPQYHIASYLGITPTQLSRIRKKMAQQ